MGQAELWWSLPTLLLVRVVIPCIQYRYFISFFTRQTDFSGRSPQHATLPLPSLNLTHPLQSASHFSSSPPYSSDQTQDYSRLQHFPPPHSRNFTGHSAGRGCAIATQPIPGGMQMPSHQFMYQRIHPPTLPPQKHTSIDPDSNLPAIPCDKEQSRSSSSSVPNLSLSLSQSDHDQNQTLAGNCVLSDRSSSASDSGCPSELPGLVSDHDYEGLSPTLQS